MKTFLDKNAQTTLCLKGLFAGRQEGESRFDASLKYWKLSTTIKNESVTNFFYAALL